jgi:co-chaperonin GroES (HSP10)
METIRPMHDRVLVRRLDEQALTSSLIEVVRLDDAKPSLFAEVVSVGALKHSTLNPGDRVVTKPWAGTPIPVRTESGTEDLYLVVEDDVLGVFRP